MDDLQALQEWTRLYIEGLGRTHRAEGRKSARVTHDCETWLRTAGFVNVSSDVRDVPTYERQRTIGAANLSNLKDLIRSLAQYPIVNRGVRSFEEFGALVEAACSELENAAARPHTMFGMKT
ncbi:hypothetical protein LTR84_006864 [Exophiala bonariae]|uniref:Uncharacterized protein n=1 Tax=Exophiala bonariae TaxID=1690606 RepID=A0AAV9N1B2_9EURO|nr:hypothetical protein LTR84_006864 [Exophiala bonariae]